MRQPPSQSALALYDYESAHMAFLPGHLAPRWLFHELDPAPGGYNDNGRPKRGAFWSWMMWVAPFTEQESVYVMADLTEWPWWQYQPNEKTINSISVPIYICPSETRGAAVYRTAGGDEASVTSYLGVSGRDSYKETGGQDGMLYANSAVTFSAIGDGSSNMLLIGERTASQNLQFGWQWAGAGANGLGEADVVLGVHERITVGQSSDSNLLKRISSVLDGLMMKAIFIDFIFGTVTLAGGMWALADASVQFYSYQLDRGNNGSTGFSPTVLEELATRNGNETISSIQ